MTSTANLPTLTTSVISARILALVAQGTAPLVALRLVCGATVVDAMIGDLYDALRAKGPQ